MKCGECQLAQKFRASFKKVGTDVVAFEADYCNCPLDEDDYYPEDFDCVNEDAYKELLAKGEQNYEALYGDGDRPDGQTAD